MRIALLAIVGGLAAFPAWAQSYCDSRANSSSYEWISSVAVNGEVKASGTNGGYRDGTAETPFKLTGVEDRLEVRPGFASTNYSEHWGAWIDFNQNSVFETSERVLTARGTGLQSATLKIPAGLSADTARMRVVMRWGSDPQPCASYSYGETEDYQVKLPAAASSEYPFTLSLQPGFWVVRSGEPEDKLTLVVQKDGQTVLERNAAGNLRDRYWSNTAGSHYQLWLKAFVDGAYRQVSNKVEYRPGITDSVTLERMADGSIQSTPFMGAWVVEQNGQIVYRQPTQGEPLFFAFQFGGQYRVWAESVVNGIEQAVSIPLAFREGFPSPYIDLEVDADFRLYHNEPSGQPLIWMIREDGQVVYQQPTQGDNQLRYPFQAGRKYKAWLSQAVSGEIVQVSDAEYFSPGLSDQYRLDVDTNRQVTRSGALGENLTWVIEEGGDIVLRRNASNELSYSYYQFDPAKAYRVWLHKFIDGYYQRVSNVVRYGAGNTPAEPEPEPEPVGQFQLTVDSNHTLARSGGTAQALQWVIEENGQIVLQRWAETELSYQYFGYTPGKAYRSWLVAFIDGEYKRVSNIVGY